MRRFFVYIAGFSFPAGGQVGYKDESRVFRCRVEKSNTIVNALNRSKKEEHPDLAAQQEERAKEHRRYCLYCDVNNSLFKETQKIRPKISETTGQGDGQGGAIRKTAYNLVYPIAVGTPI